MNLGDAIKSRRTIRRYKQKPVDDKMLLELIDFARFAPSGGNMQQIRYVIVRSPETAKKVFEQTAWGATVRPKRSPEWGKDAPSAFIVETVHVKSVGNMIHADAGAAIQNILLKAVELGLGTCWIGSFKETEVSAVISLNPEMKILYVVAIGFPDEKPVQEDVKTGEPIKYYLDEKDLIHVPKLNADSISEWK